MMVKVEGGVPPIILITGPLCPSTYLTIKLLKVMRFLARFFFNR